MKDELTTKMHSEFTVDPETDLMHRVWSILSEAELRKVELKALIQFYDLTDADIEKYRMSYIELKK